MDLNLDKVKSVHCIGIGGIGLSAIARMFLLAGKKVTGSDRSQSKVTSGLEKLGVKIFFSHNASNITEDCDLVLYSNALPVDNPEILEAKSRKIPTLSYPEILGLVLKDKFTIAISGTHGKTTTTAMVGKILIDAGLDPTIIVGSFIKNLESGEETNFVSGKSGYVVVEADEYKEAFLNLSPRILVITNIDEDHLDHYRDLAHIQETFGKLVGKIPREGFLVTDIDNFHIEPVLENAKCAIIDYTSLASVWKLSVPGNHNTANAKAAATVAGILGVSGEVIKKSLESFLGVWRRFEYKGETIVGALVFDDYAHNPQKVSAALASARALYPEHKIYAVFQPHLYSRTKTLFKKFVDAFGDADHVILAPIYAAREDFDKEINSEMLAEALRAKGKDAQTFASFTEIVEYLAKNLRRGDVCIVMGAGDVDKVSREIVVISP